MCNVSYYPSKKQLDKKHYTARAFVLPRPVPLIGMSPGECVYPNGANPNSVRTEYYSAFSSVMTLLLACCVTGKGTPNLRLTSILTLGMMQS